MTAPYLTMADIARLYHVAEPTARRWAREDSWRRTSTRPVRYSVADAQRSYEKRHGENRRPSQILNRLMARYAVELEHKTGRP